MITREQARKIAAKHGIGEAPADDPIYNEPPSIRFINRSKESTATSDTSSEQQATRSDPHLERLAGVEEEMQRRINLGTPKSSKQDQTEE